MTPAEIRKLFPVTRNTAYFNSAAVGLGSTRLREAHEGFLRSWMETGFDYLRAEALRRAAVDRSGS